MKWFLTQRVIGQPEIDVREDDEDQRPGYSLIGELARHAGSGLHEVLPGVYWGTVRDGDDQEV